MKLHFSWFTPTNGDGERIGLKKPEREPNLNYIVEVARASERAGFDGILIPVGTPFLDSWMVGSAVVHHTSTIRPLIAIRPGFIAPSLSAKMAATLDRFSGGRIDINIVTGGSPSELGQDGDFLPHDKRYERTEDFMEVLWKLWEEEKTDYEGPYFSLKDAQLVPRNIQSKIPAYFGGSSDAGKEAAARYGDVYLQWGEDAREVAEQIEDVRSRAGKYGRTLEFGIRIHVIVRDTEKEAWEAADKLVSDIDPSVELRMSEYYREADSVAQQRMNRLLQGDYRFGKHKWAGIGRVRKGAGTAVVGNPEQVREGLQEYIDIGVTHFILSGFPHLEEAERVGQLLLPQFRNQRVGNVSLA
ncbi:LLM class flavin-dependent oxidoreductase [Paenibacillus validus]|uniref:LLM class flavin-dependent oxidoreductase n=1 Tax=Paenibacillus validus TaxID=44253 RepID=A0A7X2Z973_9BACL|nr:MULTISPECIES: LLM class flavin-dependent oxidoreductase [Paenibacillus]MED4599784.1 LLM class flavin-dependent oxidoreductase [Paenibacillus validus]MED4604681.1 LLM class flavin-dependent oxidoreductase [Paenibacillus validus]MUG70665.1 LLM class flavin-dependent oxidoreductase [Paenibacillus validus]